MLLHPGVDLEHFGVFLGEIRAQTDGGSHTGFGLGRGCSDSISLSGFQFLKLDRHPAIAGFWQ